MGVVFKDGSIAGTEILTGNEDDPVADGFSVITGYDIRAGFWGAFLTWVALNELLRLVNRSNSVILTF